MSSKNHVPRYRKHKQSGQAIVTLPDGLGARRDILLGKYGSDESASCVHPEPSRCDADEALEVTAEDGLVREAGARRDLCQGEVAYAQELLGPLDASFVILT